MRILVFGVNIHCVVVWIYMKSLSQLNETHKNFPIFLYNRQNVEETNVTKICKMFGYIINNIGNCQVFIVSCAIVSLVVTG